MRVFYEVYGSGEPTVLLLPTWSIIHSRHWKAQIPYLARHARVVTFDGRGNGRSDRPAHGRRLRRARVRRRRARRHGRDGHRARRRRRAVGRRPVGRRCSPPSTRSASRARCSSRPRRRSRQHLARVDHAVRRAARVLRGLGEVQPPLLARATTATSSSSSSAQVFTEPHSTKQIEDCVGWGLETDARDAGADHARPRAARPRASSRDLCDADRLPGARHPRRPTTRSGPFVVGRGARAR